MSHFREVFRCDHCGKIYRSDYYPGEYAFFSYDRICGKCGSKNMFSWVIVKPKLFGLKGWRLKEMKNELSNK